MMTVAELIQRLASFDPTLPVVTGGFDEGGCDPLNSFEIVEIVPIKQTSHGPAFEEVQNVRPQFTEIVGEPFTALCIDH